MGVHIVQHHLDYQDVEIWLIHQPAHLVGEVLDTCLLVSLALASSLFCLLISLEGPVHAGFCQRRLRLIPGMSAPRALRPLGKRPAWDSSELYQ